MAYFLLLRHKPWLNPKLINAVVEGAKTSAHSFKIILGKPLGRTDLLTLMDERRDVTSFTETSIRSQRNKLLRNIASTNVIFIDGLKVLRKGVGACTVVGKDVRTIIYFIRDRFPFVFEEEVRQKSFTVMINFISNVSKVFLSCRTNPYLNRLFLRNFSNSTGLLQFLTFL